MEENEINKVLKPKKALLIVTIVALVITLGFIVAALYTRYEERKDPLSISELMDKGEEKKEQYVQLDIAYLPYSFAADGEEEDNYYYFAMDEEQYMYIVRLTNKTYDKIKALYEEANGPVEQIAEDAETKPIQYHFEGFTFTTSASLKKLAISAANEAFGENVINSTNFSEYLGTVYIDEKETPDNSNVSNFYAMAVIAGAFTFIMAICAISQMTTTRKVLKNTELVEELKEELRSMGDNPYSKMKLYLTNKYIISKSSGLMAIKYEDVIWEYVLINYRNGIETGRQLLLCTNEKKKITIATTSSKGDEFNDIMVDIQDKNENVKIGYTKENREFFRNYQRGVKEN